MIDAIFDASFNGADLFLFLAFGAVVVWQVVKR